MRINDILTHKPSAQVITIRPDATVRDLLGLLAEHNIGAVVVSGDGQAVDGIVSERDVVRRLHADESVLDAQTFPDRGLDIDGIDPARSPDLVLTRTGWPGRW